MYGAVILRALSRNATTSLPFGLREVIDVSQDIIQERSAVELLVNIDNALFSIGTAMANRSLISRSEREAIIQSLKSAASTHETHFRLIRLSDISTLRVESDA